MVRGHILGIFKAILHDVHVTSSQRYPKIYLGNKIKTYKITSTLYNVALKDQIASMRFQNSPKVPLFEQGGSNSLKILIT